MIDSKLKMIEAIRTCNANDIPHTSPNKFGTISPPPPAPQTVGQTDRRASLKIKFCRVWLSAVNKGRRQYKRKKRIKKLNTP